MLFALVQDSDSLIQALPDILSIYSSPTIVQPQVRVAYFDLLPQILKSRSELIGPSLEWQTKEGLRLSKLSGYSGVFHSFLQQTNGIIEAQVESSNDISPISINLLATSLDIQLSLRDQSLSRPSVALSSVVITRRNIRKHHSVIPKILSHILSQSQPSISHIPLLGLTIDVALRLRVGSETTKGSEGGVGWTYLSNQKDQIRKFFIDTVISSKTAVPQRYKEALLDYIHNFIGKAEVENDILPTTEKMLLRSPEITLPVIISFFSKYKGDLDGLLLRFIPSLLSVTKSQNENVRSLGPSFVKTVVKANNEFSRPFNWTNFSNEIINLPKTGKTASPDHRSTLFTLLSFIPSGDDVSKSISETLPPLLLKETNDTAIQSLTSALAPHLAKAFECSAVSSASYTPLVSALSSSKPIVKRATGACIGDVIYSIHNFEALQPFVKAILPSFEAELKTVCSNALTTPAGPLIGYIIVATMSLLSKSESKSPAIEAFLNNPNMKSISTTGAKPSFILNDKVYRKLATYDEELWFRRSLEAIINDDSIEFTKELSVAVGLAFLHLVLQSSNLDTRRESLDVIRDLSVTSTKRISSSILDGILTHVDNGITLSRIAGPVLVASVSPSSDKKLREDLVAKSLLVAHHKLVDGDNRGTWIELSQNAQIDTRALINEKSNELFDLVKEGAKNPNTVDASSRALTTLTFVAPSVTVPIAIEQIKLDLDPKRLQFIDNVAVGMWKMPEGVPYIDVLAAKTSQVQDKNRKGYAIEQWENEIRQSIAAKKQTTQKLSPKDKAEVDAQLEKEKVVRERVQDTYEKLSIGLISLKAIAIAKVDEIKSYIYDLVLLLLKGALLKGGMLVEGDAVETYLVSRTMFLKFIFLITLATDFS